MTSQQEAALLRYANESGPFDNHADSLEALAVEIASPNWDDRPRWNWEWYEVLPESIRAVWADLPPAAKIMARICANEAIGRFCSIE